MRRVLAGVYLLLGILGLLMALLQDSNTGWFFLGMGLTGMVVNLTEHAFRDKDKPGQPNYQLTAENRIPVFNERPKPPRAPNLTPRVKDIPTPPRGGQRIVGGDLILPRMPAPPPPPPDESTCCHR